MTVIINNNAENQKTFHPSFSRHRTGRSLEVLIYLKYCKVWGFHGGDYEECCLLVWTGVSEEGARPLIWASSYPCKWFVVMIMCLLKRWLLSNRGSIVACVTWRTCLQKLCQADDHIPSQYLPNRIRMNRCFILTRQVVAYNTGDTPGRIFGGNLKKKKDLMFKRLVL
jgi:hypothetical protein